MKVVRIAALAGLVLLVAALTGVGLPEQARGTESQQGQQTERQITVSGMASVKTVPNRAQVSFGVISEGATARAALAANSTEMRRVIDAVKAAGIDGDDIQTQQVSLSPRYSEDGQRIIGYTAQNTVGATIKNIDRVGAVIDAAVSAGANQVYGPSLVRSDQSDLYRSALRAAVADARSKAQTLAAAGQVTLGRVVSVNEGSSVPPHVLAEEARAQPDASAPPIEPGTQLVEASVSVTFEIT